MSLFEKASRLKLRFKTTQGQLNVEDLWALPLTSASKVSLDSVAKECNRALKDSEEESFVSVATKANQLLSLRLEIVKYIISVRLQEREEAKNAVVKSAQKDKIKALIAKKEDEGLESLSKEELLKMLDA